MGYELHITRQESWLDKNKTKEITIADWKKVVDEDASMRLDNYAEATTTSGEALRIDQEGIAVWTEYSKSGINGNYAWFAHENGNIDVKNPDDEIIGKMIELAELLQAKVQGDEEEIYTRDSLAHKDKKKPWWKFF
jgi:hypothetical protein